MASETPIRSLAKPLRRDIRRRIKSLTEWTRLLSAIDPGFEGQIAGMGLGAEALNMLGLRQFQANEPTQQQGKVLQQLRKKKRDEPAPFKSLRRQLRFELNVLLGEIALLQQLDTSFDRELESLGLTEVLKGFQRTRG